MDVQTGLLGLTSLVGGNVAQTLIASEIPLPAGRDAGEVLSASARAAVDGAECAEGAIRVSGRLTLLVVCASLSGEPFGFTAESAFTQTVAMDAAGPGMTAEVSAQVMECAVAPDALKLKLTAVLELSALVTAPVTTPFVTDITGGTGVEKRTALLSSRRRVLLGEASVRVREETEGKGVARVLLYHGTAEPLGVRYTGAGTLEAEGRLAVTVLVELETGELAARQVSLPFQCGFEAAFLSCVWAECTVEALSVSAADVSFGLLDTEAAVRLRLYGAEETECAPVTDAYDATGSFCCEKTQVDRLTCAGAEQQSFSIQENVLIPKHLPDALRPVYAAAMPAVTGIYEKNGLLSADVMLLTSVIYRCDEGKLHCFTEDLPAQLDFHAPFSPEARVRVNAASVVPGGGGRTLSLQFQLSALAVLYDTEPVELVSALVPGGSPCPYEGVLVYCADAGESLWDVGKRFLVPTAALQAWNTGLSEPLAEGQPVVLIK